MADQQHLRTTPGHEDALAPARRDLQVTDSIVTRQFNGFLQPRDPQDMLGRWLRQFDLAVSIPLPANVRRQSESIRRDICYAVEDRLRTDVGGNVSHEMVDYDDVKALRERPRRYIVARLQTERDTTVTTLFRCYVAGDNLYFAADSFLLGRVRWLYVIAQLLLTCFVLLGSFWNPLAWLPAGIYLWWAWADVVRASRFGDMRIGLRARYPLPLKYSSFDVDDTLIFLKAVIPLLSETIRDALRHYGVDNTTVFELLDEIRQNAYKSSISISNSGGGVLSMIGSNIGGRDNTVRA